MPLKVLPVTVSVAPPKLSMPPPTLPPKKEPPPPPRAWLPLKVQDVTTARALVEQAAAEDIDGVGGGGRGVVGHGIMIQGQVEPASLRMPPPPKVVFSSPMALPLAMVRPARVTVAACC